MTGMTFPALLQRFFTDRLCTQMEASRHTIAGYRNTFRLLVRFVAARSGKPPTCLGLADLDAEVIGPFLIHIELARGNGARSRNTRLAAARSFVRSVPMTRPECLLHCPHIIDMQENRDGKRGVMFCVVYALLQLLPP